KRVLAELVLGERRLVRQNSRFFISLWNFLSCSTSSGSGGSVLSYFGVTFGFFSDAAAFFLASAISFLSSMPSSSRGEKSSGVRSRNIWGSSSVMTGQTGPGSCAAPAGLASRAPGWRHGGPDILFPGYQQPLSAVAGRPFRGAGRFHITGERVSCADSLRSLLLR